MREQQADLIEVNQEKFKQTTVEKCTVINVVHNFQMTQHSALMRNKHSIKCQSQLQLLWPSCCPFRSIIVQMSKLRSANLAQVWRDGHNLRILRQRNHPWYQGWTNIQKQTMLRLKVATVDQVNSIITPLMDRGLLHRHLHEDSTQEEMSLTYVPYWIVSISARTSIIATDETAQLAQAATTAVLMGVIFGGMGGGFGGAGWIWQTLLRVKFQATPLLGILGLKRIRIMASGMGMGYGGGMKKTSNWT